VGKLIASVGGGIVAVLILIVGVCAAVVSAFFGGDSGGGGGCDIVPGGPVAGLTADQANNAATIVNVGKWKAVPARGWVIAVATALQESNLVNPPGGDRDSIGLFQQRPSQGWGTPAQLHDPQYASVKFYERLVKVPGWEQMPLTDAAQAVQRSAYPGAYAMHEPRATAIVQELINGRTDWCDPKAISPSGWTLPVPGPLVSGFRTPDRPAHQGIDLGASKGTLIRAASAGVVVTVTCNATLNGQPYSCDQDGSVSVMGCGWYVEIRHAGNIVTRYCHQVRSPRVYVGQRVEASQPIGWVGTSGNSSGPHLHFEIHSGYPANNSNAVDPVAYLRAHGVEIK
jgi:murein DD-endopeptidase MepM/ murein hydrolase activator NlpD